MRTLRVVLALVAVVGLVATVDMLGRPPWTVPPTAAVAVAVLGTAVAGAGVGGRRRVLDAALTGAAILALTATLVTAVLTPASVSDDAATLRARTAAAVTAALTVEPGAADARAVEARLRVLAPLLTDRALDDLRSQGPDAALPGAVATGGTQQAVVQSVGVASDDGDSARALVYASLRVTIPAVVEGSVVPIARWAVMRRVEGTWRLADLHPVGPGG